MNHYAVIGAGFGDEGKGMVVNSLCSHLEEPVVVRFSGGQQAAHHVVLENGVSHVFSNFGSGSFHGCPTYWSKYCTFEPFGMLRELEILNQKGCNPIIYIDKECPVTTLPDIEHNLDKTYVENGTCGVGIGATWERENKFFSVKVGDILYKNIFLKKMLEIHEHYYIEYEEDIIYDLIECFEKILSLENVILCSGIPKVYKSLIFEGSQGLMLDPEIGFFPHVTRTNTGTKNITKMGYSPEIFLITRAYQTRHGNGPMSNEEKQHFIKENPFEKNKSDGIQGEFRKAVLDLDVINYAISKDEYLSKSKEINLVVTCMDLIEGGYVFTKNNEIISLKDEMEFLMKIKDNILNIKNVYYSKSPFGVEKYEF